MTALFFENLYNTVVRVDPKFRDPKNFPNNNEENNFHSNDEQSKNKE